MVTTLIKAVTLTYYIIDIHIIINRDNRDFRDNRDYRDNRDNRDYRDYRDAGTTTKSSITFSDNGLLHRPCCLPVVSFVSASLSSLKPSRASRTDLAASLNYPLARFSERTTL